MLSVMLLAVFQLNPPLGHAPAPAYLERQTSALQPSFRHELSALSAASYYYIDASVDLDNATVKGVLNLRFTNVTDRSLSELVFRLLPNANTIYGGGSLSIDTVSQGSQSLDYVLLQDGTVMRVSLAKWLPPRDSVTLDVRFVTQIPVNSRRGYGILNQTYQITSLAGWYPVLTALDEGWRTPGIPQVGDAVLSETSLYEVSLRVPDDVSVVSTGRVTRVEQDGDEKVWHLVSGPAREFAAAISADFEQYEAQVDGVTARFHALPGLGARTSPDVALEMIAAAFGVFSDQFGPYPFTEFDVVEAPVSIGGYEFPGMVYVDSQLRRGGSPADYRYIVAHEVAHQWWYGLVGNDSVEEPWLDESLASYSAAIYLEKAEGKAAGDALIAYWRRVYGQPGAAGPPVNSSALEFTGWPAYRSPAYYQGALFLDALREELGDAAFYLLTRRYLADFRFASATTEDFLRLAEEIACRDLDPLFARWFQLDGSVVSTACPSLSSGPPLRNSPR
jgi:aminopeptidase N